MPKTELGTIVFDYRDDGDVIPLIQQDDLLPPGVNMRLLLRISDEPSSMIFLKLADRLEHHVNALRLGFAHKIPGGIQ
jgi:hypothetical protein